MSVRKRTWTTPKGIEKEAWVVDYADGSGKRRNKQFARKKAADQFAARAKVEVSDGTHIPEADSITIAEGAKLWISSKRRAGREMSTIDQYQQHIDLHIVPFIGETRLSAFLAPALAKFEDDMLEAGRSIEMVKKVRTSVGSILAHCQRRGLVARNVVREVRGAGDEGAAQAAKRASKKLRVGIDIPTPDEAKAIIGIIGDLAGRWRPLILTAIFNGLRASELRGLTWPDIDFAKGELHVRQRADRYNHIGRPKSEAGDRVVPIPPKVLNALREWRLSCPRRKTGRIDDAGNPIRELHLVFPNGEGNIESLGNIINRGLKPAQVAAGVVVDTGQVDDEGRPVLAAKYTGMHSLRHFYASWCINRKVDGGLELPAKVVQERLGHSSIKITMDTYGHLFPRGDDGAEMASAEASLFS